MGHCQQAPGRKTTYDILCPLPNIQRVFPIFSMMQTLILPDSRKGKGIIRYRPAWTIALSCCLKDVADPCWSKISTRGIPFGMVWQCRAGIWSRALKDLAYQRPWRTASGSNLDIKRDNTVATCCRRNFPVVSCFPEGFPTSNLGRRKHVAQTLWMPWPKKVAQNVSYGCKCFTSFLLLFSSAWWGEKTAFVKRALSLLRTSRQLQKQQLYAVFMPQYDVSKLANLAYQSTKNALAQPSPCTLLYSIVFWYRLEWIAVARPSPL